MLLASITAALFGTSVAPPTPFTYKSSRIMQSVPSSSFLRKSPSASEVLSTLHWTSLSDRRQQKLLSLSQQLLQPKLGKTVPSYLRNLLPMYRTYITIIHTRGAAQGHQNANQVQWEYGKKPITHCYIYDPTSKPKSCAIRMFSES